MLDIKFIRENAELVRLAAVKKRLKFEVEELLTADKARVKLLGEVETLRAEQNAANVGVAGAKDHAAKIGLIAKMKPVKDKLQTKETELATVMKEWQKLMLEVPNIPDVSVPEGADETANQEVHVGGTKPQFKFEPKDHVELMMALGMVDFERGTKAHGFRGYFLRGAGAELSWALWNYARDFFRDKKFVPFIAPTILKKEYFYGTGHLPREADDLYKTQDDDYLSGTAEVAMMAYHGGEILKKEELPKRYLAFSPCYRREAGSYGKDTKGLVRVHDFYKLEQLVLCRADHAESEKLHEEINANFEKFVESLGLPYRRLLICGGELGLSKVKQYDTEVWFPSQNVYRELSSASYYHDFQSRRFNIRYDENGKKQFVHSLNCTAVATPRILAAIVENYQEADGSVRAPEVLQKYLGQKVIVREKAS
ncbi:MAG: serine--tRNA ligase [Candidatus Vogelbacteria bacterium]|nr:serine--tRNA ligase [Candidatus Vogelbacteria bacterium]